MEPDLCKRSPYAAAQEVLAGRWSMLILHLLESGPVRFNELQRRLPDMTRATLAKQLRRLEQSGLIHRREYRQIPPKVEYSLSEMGNRFRSVLDALRDWGMEYLAWEKGAGPDAPSGKTEESQ